ncbi:hypothetical protein [Geodermatophilus siccatus]|uniref:hypothetical protein n=1 Tax=Geodermatophilus siccatus TaxID=1137991 RepID=UPI001587E940|nr:hypothetical protein [Geodermatophilus siccatus]
MGKAAELRRLRARQAMDAACEAELVLGLADDTPDTLDPPPDRPGARKGSWAPEPELPGVSQFFTAELAVVLNCGRRTAANLAHRAWTHREHLPATWAALAVGALDEPRAKVLADVLGLTAPAIARAVEARLLPEAIGTGPAAEGWRATAGPAASGHRSPGLLTHRDHVSVRRRVGWSPCRRTDTAIGR